MVHDMYKPRRIALTGATGALGFAFLRHIFACQPELRATLLVRRSSPSFAAHPFQTWLRQYSARIKLVEGDICRLNRSQIDALLETDGGLWHFAAITSLSTSDQDVARQIYQVNFEATSHLANACARRWHQRSFYHVSTAYVMGRRTGTVLEGDGFLGQEFRNPYEASKSAAEKVVQDIFSNGVPGLIFRPSVVIDNSGLTGGFKIVDACAFAVAMAVRRREEFVFRLPDSAGINMVHSDWLIEAMLDLARMPSGPGRTYHLTACNPTLFRDIADILSELVPDLQIRFEPNFLRSDLPNSSKLFDKAATELRPYFEAKVNFDRMHVASDLSPALRQPVLKLRQFVEMRLRAELDRLSERQAARRTLAEMNAA